MSTQMTTDPATENRDLRREFERRGLNPADVVEPMRNLEWTNRSLRSLLRWVDAYKECPDRVELEANGFRQPPLEPFTDNTCDWIRFERWVNRQPPKLTVDEALWFVPPPNCLTYISVVAELESLIQKLEIAGVRIHCDHSISELRNYEQLYRMLAITPRDELATMIELTIPSCTRNCRRCDHRCGCDCTDYYPDDWDTLDDPDETF